MKYLLLIFTLLLSAIGFSQDPNCKSVRTGKFKIVTKETGVTLIERSADKQTEEDPETGDKTVSDIIWIDDCTYQLRNMKFIKGKPYDSDMPGEIFTCKIIKIKSESYIVQTTSNFSDMMLEREVLIVK